MDCLCGVWGVGRVQMQYDDNRAVTLTANLTASRAKSRFGVATATTCPVAPHARCSARSLLRSVPPRIVARVNRHPGGRLRRMR